jgi:hypothetical protein
MTEQSTLKIIDKVEVIENFLTWRETAGNLRTDLEVYVHVLTTDLRLNAIETIRQAQSSGDPEQLESAVKAVLEEIDGELWS